jgi:hypothetical protein
VRVVLFANRAERLQMELQLMVHSSDRYNTSTARPHCATCRKQQSVDCITHRHCVISEC